MKYLVLAILCLILAQRAVSSTFTRELFAGNADLITKLSSSLKEEVKPIVLASEHEISINPKKEEHKHQKNPENDHVLKQKEEKLKQSQQLKDQSKTLKKYTALLQILQNALKQKYLQQSKQKTRFSITQGTYLLQYYHTVLPSDKVVISNGHLVTAQRGANKFFVKRHVEGGMSLYETLQDKASGKWVKATKDENSLVDDQTEATWFQIFGMGSMFVLQYFNPYDIVDSNQFGVNNGPIGTQLRITTSQTEFFKLIPV